MDLPSAFVLITGAGAAGGALNALGTDNQRLVPSRVVGALRRTLFRPGLAVNVIAGAGLSGGTFWSFAGATPAAQSRALVPVIVGLLIGWLAARWITNEADKRILREAVCMAAAAPAADSATIRGMEAAPPAAVLKAAAALQPRRATHR